MPWNFRQYGSASDPIHKSHLNGITGDYGCPKKFRYEMDARADRDFGADERETISGKAAAGTAAHETIARALNNLEMREHLLAGKKVSLAPVALVFGEEYARELGGRTAQWYGRDEEAEELADRVAMIVGLLNGLHERVHSIELLEAGFIAKLGDYWLSGHIDLIYRPKEAPDTLALSDWKTGASKPVAIELDHSWEAGVYSTALRHGNIVPRECIVTQKTASGHTRASIGARSVEHASRYIAEREVLERELIDIAQLADGGDNGANVTVFGKRFEEFPSRIHYVHLADYVPYQKAGTKAVKRPEDLAFYGYEEPQSKHKYVAGDLRGPAWLPVKLTEYDLPRLLSRLRNVVGMIRMGRFIDQVGERCNRCTYARDCLNSGYQVTGDEKRELDRTLRSLPLAPGDALDAADD